MFLLYFIATRLSFLICVQANFYAVLYILIYISFLSFQLPTFLGQVKEALGLPSSQAPPVAGPSFPVPSGPPPILLENSESDDDVQTLAVPVRSGSSEAFLPMVSTDDSWTSDTEFR